MAEGQVMGLMPTTSSFFLEGNLGWYRYPLYSYKGRTFPFKRKKKGGGGHKRGIDQEKKETLGRNWGNGRLVVGVKDRFLESHCGFFTSIKLIECDCY